MDPVTAALNFATAAVTYADHVWEALTEAQKQVVLAPILDLIQKASPHASQALAAPPVSK